MKKASFLLILKKMYKPMYIEKQNKDSSYLDQGVSLFGLLPIMIGYVNFI